MWYNISNKRNLEDQNHGYQAKTQIAGFEFDNCLMNAAGGGLYDDSRVRGR